MFRKKIFVLILILSLSTTLLLSGCDSSNSNTTSENDKITIYTTLFVLTDFSKRIGGEYVEVINLIPAGASSHDYEPTAKEMVALTNSDLFIYNGVGMESWLEKIIANLEGKDVKLIDASKGITPITGEAHDHNHDNDGDHDSEHKNNGDHDHEEHEEDADHKEDANHEDEHGHNLDSHVWLNPLNALKQAENIKNALVDIDSSNAEYYEANFEELKKELIALDEKYRVELSDTMRKDFFVSHAAFGYLAERYDLTQHSISGIIPAYEPSPAELAGLIERARELDIKYVLVDPMDVTKISDVLASEINASTINIYTLGSITKEQADQGMNYISLMEENLIVFKKALNE